MNKRRLLKLADLLEADAKNKKGVRFHMHGWGYVTDPENPISCGTKACAMGLAAISGTFKRAGLTPHLEESSIRFRWKGRKIDGFTAAEKLFGISPEASDYFFAPSDEIVEGAADERRLARRIRRFVAGKLRIPA
jgi:hypothetical protein